MLPKTPGLRPLKHRKRGVFIEQLRNFCEETNMHGWRFIVSKDSQSMGKSIWIIIIVMAIFAVSALLTVAYTSFMSNPTVVFTESTHSMVWNYPFPAITICSYNQMSKASVLEFIKTLKTNRSQEALLQDMKILFQLISITNASIPKGDIERMHTLLEDNGVDVEALLGKLAPKCETIIDKCKWKAEEKRCRTLFEPQITSSGFCCSFNYYGVEKGESKEKQGELRAASTPRRLSSCGFRTGLEVLIHSHPEDYFATQIPSIGHLIFIHPTYNYPQFTTATFTLSINSFNFFNIQPTVTYATDNVRNLDIARRKCAFSDEIKLHNFKEYSYENCLVECRMNITVSLCGCIPFYYANPFGTYPKTRVCNLKDVLCLRDNHYLLTSSKPGYTHNKQNGTEARFKCNCYKDCETYIYNVQVAASKVSRKYSTNHLDLYAGAEIENSTVARIFYVDLVGIRNRNDAKFDLDGLIAFYGGLLSLFLGFSAISVCEIIYFLIIRTLIQIFKKHKRRKTINVKEFRRERQ